MNREETFDEKYQKMTKTPIPSLIGRLAVPTIVSMMITSVYNMADTFYVGQIGTSATAAVGVVFSLMAIIQAIGFTLGMGSGNYISRLLGQKNQVKAEEIAATGFLSALGVGAIVTVAGLIFLDQLIRSLGTTETILPYAKAYARLILLGAPYMAASFVLNNLLRFQGSAFYSMLGIGTGGILNILLDPLFIFVFHMGIEGAALATILSQLVSFCILLLNCGRGGNIPIRIKCFRPKWAIYKEILRGGLPSFYRQGLASIAVICLNSSAAPFGDAAIAAMSIVARVFQFALSALLGFGQGFQPVCGFNYGAKRYDRVLEAFWFCFKIALVALVLIGIAGFIFSPQIITIFRREDLEVISIGSFALRVQCITFPFMAWVTITNMLLQTIGKATKASILALARQGLFFLPVILTLPRIFGVFGVQISQPIADVATLLISVPMGISVLKELRQQQEANLEQAA